jgi:hypothetical protein
MTREQEEALEAAKLAAMVGSELKKVDSLTSERQSVPANRIDINQFIAKVKGQQVHQHQQFQSNPFGGPSPYLSEDRVQQMVPDAPVAIPEIASQMIPLPQPPPISETKVINNEELIQVLKNIDEKLEKIGNTFQSMVELIQTKLN